MSVLGVFIAVLLAVLVYVIVIGLTGVGWLAAVAFLLVLITAIVSDGYGLPTLWRRDRR